MTTRVLILGATGMLGHTLMRELDGSEAHEVFGTARQVDLIRESFPSHLMDHVFTGIDARDVGAVTELLKRLEPSIVVNCIGVIKQDPAVTDAVNTITLNALLPHLLVRECAGIGARLIHISTDCVFSGHGGGYVETDNPDPVDFYGRSKLLGEVTAPPALTLRTSTIGHELESARQLVDWFLSQSGAVNGFTGAIYSGLTTTELARLLTSVIFPRNDLVGLLHVASTPISKYELLSIIADEYKWTGEIVPFDEYVCDRSLSAEVLFSKTGYRPPPWRQMIEEMHHSVTGWRQINEGGS
jgi:dTDP-4-dehydrorhamnose reductase